jgi:ribose/xylose/arabinose/galactoside ABC-type transport system permease subunit
LRPIFPLLKTSASALTLAGAVWSITGAWPLSRGDRQRTRPDRVAGYAGRAVASRTSILGGQGTYLRTIAGAVLLVTMTALITVVNASEGWRRVILGGLILAMLPLSGRDQSR